MIASSSIRTSFAVHPNDLREIDIFRRPTYEPAATAVRQPLPIDPYLPQIVDAVLRNQVTIIVAETGAGKSTRIPAALLDAGYEVIVTQPRRIAARALARRVAGEIGSALGDVVGYRTAVDAQDNPLTRLLYCTDGLALVKELSAETNSKRIIVLDEVHEFNTNIEMLLAWLKEDLKRNPDRRIVIMSATMEKERLSNYFGGAPIIEVPGRQHQIVTLKPGKSLEQDAVKHLRDKQNVLIFEPGKAEIERTMQHIRASGVDAEILPLHADLLPEEQDRCFTDYGRPKVVVATNIAQTSITIPDVDVVLDRGLERQMFFIDGIEQLRLIPIALADEAQRRGRAGRTHIGYYRSYCEYGKGRRRAYPIPEIERESLDQAYLRFAREGLDMEKLSMFHPPERPRIREAKELLLSLGCITGNLTVTEMGRRISALPVSARIGRILIEADKRGVLDDMVTAAVLVELNGIRDRKAMVPGFDIQSDVFSEIILFAGGCQIVGDPNAAGADIKRRLENAGITPRAFFKALEARHHLADICKNEFPDAVPSSGDKKALLASLIAGNLDRVYHLYGEDRFVHFSDAAGKDKRELSRESGITFQDEPELVVGQPFNLQIKTRSGDKDIKLLTMSSKVPLEIMHEVDPGALAIEQHQSALIPQKDSANGHTSVNLFYRGSLVWTGRLPTKLAAKLPKRTQDRKTRHLKGGLAL